MKYSVHFLGWNEGRSVPVDRPGSGRTDLPARHFCATLSGNMDDSATQERYRALLQAARNLFSLTSLEDLVENVLKYSCVMMQADACSMYLPDYATRELVIYSARGRDDSINAFRIPWDKGIAGAVFQQHKFMRIDDAQNDPRLLRVADMKTGFLTRAMLCAPLIDKDDCFGVLQAINPTGRPIFTQLDQDIFEGLTNIVTGALVRFDRERKIDHERLELVEHEQVRLIDRVRAIDAARDDDADRRLLRFHHANLNRAGLGAEQPIGYACRALPA